MPNRYQMIKARRIAKLIAESAEKTKMKTTRHELAQLVAVLNADEWRSIAFSAGCAEADLDCKAAVLAILRKRAPHVIGRKEAA